MVELELASRFFEDRTRPRTTVRPSVQILTFYVLSYEQNFRRGWYEHSSNWREPLLVTGCRRNLLLVARSLQRLRCGVFTNPPHHGAKLSKLILHPHLEGVEDRHQQGELVSGDRSLFVRFVVRHCGLMENSEEVARSLHILKESTKQTHGT